VRCAAWLLLLALLCSAPLSGQVEYSSLIATSPEVLALSSPPPSSPSGTLSGASSELDSIADELETLLTALDASLAAAGISLDASDRSLESSIRSATSSIDSLILAREAAQAEARRRSVELWLWRGAAALGLAGALWAWGSR
jgi:hypothetical protein